MGGANPFQSPQFAEILRKLPPAVGMPLLLQTMAPHKYMSTPDGVFDETAGRYGPTPPGDQAKSDAITGTNATGNIGALDSLNIDPGAREALRSSVQTGGRQGLDTYNNVVKSVADRQAPAKMLAPDEVAKLGFPAGAVVTAKPDGTYAVEYKPPEKVPNYNQPFNDDGTPNKAYQDYKLREVGAEAEARQRALTGPGVDASGKAIGTLGNPAIDPTAPGYTSAIVANTGLTQASIDQKALDHLTAGTLPPQGRTGQAGIQNAAISNRMAEMAPGGNLAVNKTQLKSFSLSLNQQQKYLDNTQRALNTANDTLDSLQTWMQQNNINPSQFPDYNRFSNFLKAKGLDPGTAGGYNAQLATLRAEYSQVLAKGGVRSIETDREAAKLIPDGLSPAALSKVADRIKVDAGNVIRDSQAQVAKITGQLNGALQGQQSTPPPSASAPAPSAAAAAPVKIQNDADRARLPLGTRYTAPMARSGRNADGLAR